VSSVCFNFNYGVIMRKKKSVKNNKKKNRKKESLKPESKQKKSLVQNNIFELPKR